MGHGGALFFVVEREFVAFVWLAVFDKGGLESGDDLGVLCGEVVGFGRILLEVVELPGAGLFGLGILAHDFPRVIVESEFSSVTVKFPEHGLGAGKFFARDRGGEVGAVELAWSLDAGSGAEGGEPIREVGRGRGFAACFHFSGPADDGGDADSAFIDGAFPASEPGGGVEEGRIDSADVELGITGGMGGAVVGGEDDEGVVIEIVLLESLENGADMIIEIGDHGRVSRAGAGVGEVAILATVSPFFFVPLLGVFIDVGLGRMHGDVRFNKGKVEEEGFFLVGVDEFKGFLEDAVGCVNFGSVGVGEDFAFGLLGVSGDGVFVEDIYPAVVIEEGWVKGVGISLAVVSVETVETLGHR